MSAIAPLSSSGYISIYPLSVACRPAKKARQSAVRAAYARPKLPASRSTLPCARGLPAREGKKKGIDTEMTGPGHDMWDYKLYTLREKLAACVWGTR